MRQMRRTGSAGRGLGLTACLGAVLLVLAGPAAAQDPERELPAPAAAPGDALTEALETGELTEAEYALERARSVFQLTRVRREFGDVERPSPHDVTLILRDLAVRVDELTGADRSAAKRLLARPPQGAGADLPGNGWQPGAPEAVACGPNVCVHWVSALGDPDAPPPEDVHPPIGVPDWAETALQTWEDVWAAEIDTLGYRVPLSDFTSPHNGGDGTLDVYLEDLGSSGVFGYCTSDDPAADDPDVWTVSAYCVIDNDFEEFGDAHTPEEFMQVTSAHEFHHASQFAYDWLEDYWLLEGTAANVEETVYPDVDDNVFFLEYWSPLSRPASPLDRGGLGDSEYGSWIFWRFLQEKVGDGDPAILREIWERAAPEDVYSLLAVRRELTQRGLVFRDIFAQFGVANRLLDYADSETAEYPQPPRTAGWGLGPKNRLIKWRAWKISQLATRYFTYTPGNTGSAAKLRLEFKLPQSGARATVLVLEKDGSTLVRQLNQNAKGYVAWRAPFARATVKRVEVVLSNGSTRIASCWFFPGPPSTSCFGRPLDNNRAFKLRARLIG